MHSHLPWHKGVRNTRKQNQHESLQHFAWSTSGERKKGKKKSLSISKEDKRRYCSPQCKWFRRSLGGNLTHSSTKWFQLLLVALSQEELTDSTAGLSPPSTHEAPTGRLRRMMRPRRFLPSLGARAQLWVPTGQGEVQHPQNQLRAGVSALLGWSGRRRIPLNMNSLLHR